jgi:hypothetical protein
MKSFFEVVSTLKGVHSLFLDASLSLSGSDSRTLGQEMGVKCIVSTSIIVGSQRNTPDLGFR